MGEQEVKQTPVRRSFVVFIFCSFFLEREYFYRYF